MTVVCWACASKIRFSFFSQPEKQLGEKRKRVFCNKAHGSIIMKAFLCLYAALLVLQASLIPALEGTEASQQPNECLAKADGEVASLSSCSNEVDTAFQAQRTGTRKPYKCPEFCQDVWNDCEARMENDACIHYFDFMSENCAKSCQICSTRDPNAKTIANHKKGIVERIFAQIPQVIEGQASIDTWFHMRQVEDYMYNNVYVNHEFQEVRVDCQVRHELCTFWAATGECENNKEYMRITCAPACQTCLDLKFENRCPLDQSGPTALSKPGDLFRMFERIMSDPQLHRYNPKPILRPSNLTLDDAPWLIVLEDFLSKEECETLIAQGNARGYKPSSEAGTKKRYDGRHESTRSDRRTSSTTWCKKECASHPVAESVHERLEKLTGISQQNYEPLQLLK